MQYILNLTAYVSLVVPGFVPGRWGGFWRWDGAGDGAGHDVESLWKCQV